MCVPGAADVLLLGDAADIFEPARIETDRGIAVKRFWQDRVVDGGDDRAVLWRLLISPVVACMLAATGIF
jgi:hypothetical protein